MGIAGWAAGFCAAATAVHLASIAIAIVRCRWTPARAVPQSWPAVSVVRPVCGLEPFIADTLHASFDLDYPEYELIFCAARGDDPVIDLVRDLIDANPERPARLLIGDDRLGPNPKLNNVAKGWTAARYAWIVIADSNALLPPDALQLLLARWDRRTGLVCSMPIGSRPANFWAELECAFLNTLQARAQYVSEALGFGFAQGKTMLLNRDLVERGGGFEVLAAETAEDAAATKLVRALGRRVHLVDTAFEQPLGRRNAAAVWARQLRWARLRRISFPWLFLPELLLGSALPSLTLAIAAAASGASVPAAVAALLAVWFGAEAGLALALGWRCSPRMLLALLLRDWLLPALWVMAWIGTEFVWHGNQMRAQPRRELQAGVGPEIRARPRLALAAGIAARLRS